MDANLTATELVHKAARPLTSTALQEPPKTLGFFDLPRELRDMIYDGLLDAGVDIVTSWEAPHVRVRNLLQPDLVFVSQRFSDELAERPIKPEEFIIEDQPWNMARSLSLPDRLSRITRIEFHLAFAGQVTPEPPSARGYRVSAELDMHCNLLNSVRSMWNIRTVSINFYFRPHKSLARHEEDLIHELLSKSAMRDVLRSLAKKRSITCNVYRSNFYGEVWNFVNGKMLVMTWSPRTMELYRVHDETDVRRIQGKINASSKPWEATLPFRGKIHTSESEIHGTQDMNRNTGSK